MKFEVDTPARLDAWLDAPRAAIFQSQDLRMYSAAIAAHDLDGCAFLGCRMAPVLEQAAAAAKCLVMPVMPGLPFDPFTPSLYSPDMLFDKFDPDRPETHRMCLDWLIYESFIDPETKQERPVALDMILMRRLHDASVADALHDLLDLPTRLRTVAVMGGHDVPRDAPVFRNVALMTLGLARNGYLTLTGGGPGLMEAANLGAYAAGFDNAEGAIDRVLSALQAAPLYNHPDWLKTAFAAWKQMGRPDHPSSSRNIGIPTWFYGHEPPNVFATDIAKYFENSVREEGLLAVALGGVIFAQGNAGTVQEIFQDACQNYYRTYQNRKSPMVLVGVDYWNPTQPGHLPGGARNKPAYPLLERLASDKAFLDYVLLTDDYSAIPAFLDAHPPL